MKRLIVLAALGLMSAMASSVSASPDEDVKTYREFYKKRFPGVPLADYGDGVYAIDQTLRENWKAIEEFPPYEDAIEQGKKLFETPFKNGKTYADCFPSKGIGIAGNYPYWDKKRGQVMTLELAVNNCRKENGEEPLPYSKGKIAYILAYMANTSRGKKVNVVIPKDDPRALEAYEKGKAFYFTRRGQLNFACANCHFQNAGMNLRSDLLSPAVGHTTHWPVYRTVWGEIGNLHWRFQGCNQQVRAKPLPPQSEEYRNLEYFLSHMSNGLPMNGPSVRK